MGLRRYERAVGGRRSSHSIENSEEPGFTAPRLFQARQLARFGPLPSTSLPDEDWSRMADLRRTITLPTFPTFPLAFRHEYVINVRATQLKVK